MFFQRSRLSGRLFLSLLSFLPCRGWLVALLPFDVGNYCNDKQKEDANGNCGVVSFYCFFRGVGADALACQLCNPCTFPFLCTDAVSALRKRAAYCVAAVAVILAKASSFFECVESCYPRAYRKQGDKGEKERQDFLIHTFHMRIFSI